MSNNFNDYVFGFLDSLLYLIFNNNVKISFKLNNLSLHSKLIFSEVGEKEKKKMMFV